MKLVVKLKLKLKPSPQQAAALEATLRAVNEQANRVSQIAFAGKAYRNYSLRSLTYATVREAGIGSQAAQHVIKKVADAYLMLRAGIRNGSYGKPGPKRREKARPGRSPSARTRPSHTTSGTSPSPWTPARSRCGPSLAG